MLKIGTKILNRLVVMLLVAGFFSACASPASNVYSEAPPREGPVAKEVAGVSNSTLAQSSLPSQKVERIVIKNGYLTIVVADPSLSMDAIARMAEEMGGFVVTANLYHETLTNGIQAPRASITIRVPAERLNEAIEKIKAESSQPPLSEKIDSQDITSEYTDMQSRLRNLQNTETQLTKIMDQATKTEDVLAVYNQLVQVREQIEVLQGQIKYYDEASALSAIAVEIMANEAVQPLSIGGWQPTGVAKSAVQALINALKGIANLVIWLVIFILPVLVVLFVVFILPIRFVWRKLRPRKAKPAPTSQQPPASPVKPQE
jgi:hypothetical protein